MSHRDLRAIPAIAMWTAGVVAWSLRGCSGPQPLSVAIRADDQAAYERALEAEPTSPREAYFAVKAARTGQAIEQIRLADGRLSETRNPFDGNRDPAAVSRGAVVYEAHCMRCHGPDARGNGPEMSAEHPCKDFHSFDKRFAVTLHGGAPRTWFRKIRDGYGDTVEYPDGPGPAMPAFGEQLAREQIWLAITYLQSLDMYAETDGPSKDRSGP